MCTLIGRRRTNSLFGFTAIGKSYTSSSETLTHKMCWLCTRKLTNHWCCIFLARLTICLSIILTIIEDHSKRINTNCIHNAFHTYTPKKRAHNWERISTIYLCPGEFTDRLIFRFTHEPETLPAIQKPSIVNRFSQCHWQWIILIKVIAGSEITNPRNSSLL